SKGGGIASIVGAVISIIGSIGEAINSSRAAARQRYQEQVAYSEEYQLQQVEAVTRALERQLELIDTIYGTRRIEEFYRISREAVDAFNDSVSELGGGFDLTKGDVGR